MSKFISDKLKQLFKSAPVAASAAEAMKPSVVAVAATTAQKFMAAGSGPMKPHLPLIKFRKNSGTSSHPSQSVQAGGGSAAPKVQAPGVPGKLSTIAMPTIEDWQLPQRYRRRPIDSDEIEYINRGGPA